MQVDTRLDEMNLNTHFLLMLVLRNVRYEVVRLARSVGHEQTPALYDQAIDEFYFRQ